MSRVCAKPQPPCKVRTVFPGEDGRCPFGGVKIRCGRKSAVVCNGEPGVNGQSGRPGQPGRPGQACGSGTLRLNALSETQTLTTTCPADGGVSACTTVISDPNAAVVFDTPSQFGTVSAVGLTGLHIARAGTVLVSANLFTSDACAPLSAQIVFFPDTGGTPQIAACQVQVVSTSFILIGSTTFNAPGPGTFQIRLCTASTVPCTVTIFNGSNLTVEQIACA